MNVDTTWADQDALKGLREDLLRFARLQLRDPVLAEDVVQDTLSAAFAARNNFRGEASTRTWVASILKNKIIDQIRQRTRHASLDLAPGDEGDVMVNGLFDQRGALAQGVSSQGLGKPGAGTDRRAILGNLRALPHCTAGEHRQGFFDA